MEFPLKKEIENSSTILLCGAGGGFDIYSGIPLYFYLKSLNKNVFLANYSFSFLRGNPKYKVSTTGWYVNEDWDDTDYFPEKYLAEWLKSKGEEPQVIAFEKSGVKPLVETLNEIVETLRIDTVFLVDGGTDSLMFGDENGLGTPTEDAITLSAFSQLELDRKYLVNIGFGIDHFHGVCHAQYLENVSYLIKKGGFKGAYSVLNETGGNELTALVAYANQRGEDIKSIVANSIVSALKGDFGDVYATERTRNSELFINPLMSLYWFFDLDIVAKTNMYLELIENTNSELEVQRIIQSFRKMFVPKQWKDIPL